MNLLAFSAIAASISGLLMGLSPLAQVRRILRLRDSTAVSATVYCTLLINCSIWLIYGIASRDLPLVLANAVFILSASTTLFVIRRYRRPPASPTRPAPTPPDEPRQQLPGRQRPQTP